MSGRTLLLVCGAALLLLGGCAASEKRLSAKEYYTQANEAFAHENFATATDQYRDLLDQYPLNPYAEEAQLKIAYAYYLDKKYAEAVAAFSDFERAYPTSAHLPFVEYYRGMCYLEQMRSIDRDQSVTEKAQEFFRTVTDRYPESPFASLAEEKIKVCREALAAHELYVADFNAKNSNLPATKARLRALVENYPETEATVGALARLENLLTQEGKPELAELAAKALAVRHSAKPPAEQTTVASLAIDDLPAPGVDPLLLLIAELKKQEGSVRHQAPKVLGTESHKRRESDSDEERQEGNE
ncbi:MAG: outer membrane protein assembly factor BamD [Deltaproteobacteria bacterium]|nr:MAG: outer membrane protein assembly factor BamD [Deltaproteobacteria bacterium]